jgi:hypothetical protein
MGVGVCADCGGKVASSARACPHCGSTRKPRAASPISAGTLLLLLLVGIPMCVSATRDDTAPSATARTPAARTTQAAPKKAPPPPKPKTPQEIEMEKLVAKFGRAPVASAWDGSYSEVERYLERVARDPDSVEVDGCTEVKRATNGWLVGCNWRGRNGFGGMERQANWFTVRGGQVVAMHDYSAYRE